MVIEKIGLYGVISLQTFSLFPEYFIAISAIYITITMSLIAYNINGLMFQKALSECLGLTLLMSCFLIINDDILNGLPGFNLYAANDSLSLFSKLTICCFSSIYFFLIADSLKEQLLTSFEYLLILLLAVLGLLLLCSSNDLLTAYLSIELISLSSYLLAAFKKNSNYSIEAGVKYFITGAISSALFLLGSSFIYAYTGSIYFLDFWELLPSQAEYSYYNSIFTSLYCESTADFHYNVLCERSGTSPEMVQLLKDSVMYYFESVIGDNWREVKGMDILIENGKSLPSIGDSSSIFGSIPQESLAFLEIGMSFILFSVFIKLALAPFHLWSLDVYEGSPLTSAFFFAVITKLSLFIFLIRFCYVGMFSFSQEWTFFMMWAAVFSVFVGSFGGLKQRKLKTLLAYSSVSHMGYGMLALSTVSILGVRILLFYMIVYMVSGISTWFILLLLRIKQSKFSLQYNKELSDLSLLNKSNPAIAFGLAVTIFSVAGLPPLAGFLSKIGVFLTLLQQKLYFVCVAVILCSVVSTFYYIRLIKVLYFENCLVGKLYYPIKTNKTLFLSVSIFLLIFLFINPSVVFLILYSVTNDSLFFDFAV